MFFGFIVIVKKRNSSLVHDVKGNPKAPHINQLWIILLSQNNFWSQIRGRSAKGPKFFSSLVDSRQSKVNKFDVHVGVEKNIFSFDVSMGYIFIMKITKRLIELVKYFFDHFFSNRSLAVDVVKKLAIFTEFHENVNFGRSFYYFIDLGDILVVEVFVNGDLLLNLNKVSVGKLVLLEDFDSYINFGIYILSPIHRSKASFAQFLPNFVVGGNFRLNFFEFGDQVESLKGTIGLLLVHVFKNFISI